MNGYPVRMVTPTEQREKMISDYKKTKSAELLDEIVRKNEHFIYFVMNRSFSYADEQTRDELFSVGQEGFVRAVHNYDPKVARFSTYAYKCIWSVMKRYIEKAEPKIEFLSLEVTLSDDAVQKIHVEQEREESPVKMAALNDSYEQVKRMMEKILTEKEQIILSYRFGLNGLKPRTLSELSSEQKLTRQRLNQLELEALSKLKEAFSEACVQI